MYKAFYCTYYTHDETNDADVNELWTMNWCKPGEKKWVQLLLFIIWIENSLYYSLRV